MTGDREIRVEWLDDDGWPDDEPGLRACDVVTFDEHGDEVERVRTLARYEPGRAGDRTSRATEADVAELAARRADATGRPVAVAAFSSTGLARVYDLEAPAGAPLDEGELVDVGEVAVEPS